MKTKQFFYCSFLFFIFGCQFKNEQVNPNNQIDESIKEVEIPKPIAKWDADTIEISTELIDILEEICTKRDTCEMPFLEQLSKQLYGTKWIYADWMLIALYSMNTEKAKQLIEQHIAHPEFSPRSMVNYMRKKKVDEELMNRFLDEYIHKKRSDGLKIEILDVSNRYYSETEKLISCRISNYSKDSIWFYPPFIPISNCLLFSPGRFKFRHAFTMCKYKMGIPKAILLAPDTPFDFDIKLDYEKFKIFPDVEEFRYGNRCESFKFDKREEVEVLIYHHASKLKKENNSYLKWRENLWHGWIVSDPIKVVF